MQNLHYFNRKKTNVEGEASNKYLHNDCEVHEVQSLPQQAFQETLAFQETHGAHKMIK